jgi:hypothetical protein
MLTRSNDGKQTLWLWHAATMREIHVTDLPFLFGIGTPPIVLLPDGRTALVGAKGVHVIDASTGVERKVVLGDATVAALAASFDADFLIAGLGAASPSTRPSFVTLARSDLE